MKKIEKLILPQRMTTKEEDAIERLIAWQNEMCDLVERTDTMHTLNRSRIGEVQPNE